MVTNLALWLQDLNKLTYLLTYFTTLLVLFYWTTNCKRNYVLFVLPCFVVLCAFIACLLSNYNDDDDDMNNYYRWIFNVWI